MQRYFIRTSSGFTSHEDEGFLLPDREALSRVLRLTLSILLRNSGEHGIGSKAWADAFDEKGIQVMTAKFDLETCDGIEATPQNIPTAEAISEAKQLQ